MLASIEGVDIRRRDGLLKLYAIIIRPGKGFAQRRHHLALGDLIFSDPISQFAESRHVSPESNFGSRHAIRGATASS